jgi:predicted  nucleic acid-binding Zn-ribbon protein
LTKSYNLPKVHTRPFQFLRSNPACDCPMSIIRFFFLFTGTAASYEENGHTSPQATTQAQDRRNVLQMLQKSIASELDLGKELCDARYVVEQLKMNLYQADQQSYFLEESVEAIYQRMLSAENASQLFLETSKDLLAKINAIPFYSSASVPRDGDLKSKLEEGLSNDDVSSKEKMPADNANQEAVPMYTPSLLEFSSLQDKIRQLEECLRGSASQPQWSSLPRGANQEDQDVTRSEITTVRDIINELKFAISKAESRAQNAEARCTQLTQTNDQLYAELNSDRAGILEKRLKESGTQLEHAKASVDAVVEQQGMLKASMSDMEQMIEDLKEKFCKAETRAENAESKCKLLTDTNLELSEELSFLRGRVEGLENSLRQANQLKVFTAKDIDVKTKTISDLVAKLALERERLHLQV